MACISARYVSASKLSNRHFKNIYLMLKSMGLFRCVYTFRRYNCYDKEIFELIYFK